MSNVTLCQVESLTSCYVAESWPNILNLKIVSVCQYRNVTLCQVESLTSCYVADSGLI